MSDTTRVYDQRPSTRPAPRIRHQLPSPPASRSPYGSDDGRSQHSSSGSQRSRRSSASHSSNGSGSQYSSGPSAISRMSLLDYREAMSQELSNLDDQIAQIEERQVYDVGQTNYSPPHSPFDSLDHNSDHDHRDRAPVPPPQPRVVGADSYDRLMIGQRRESPPPPPSPPSTPPRTPSPPPSDSA